MNLLNKTININHKIYLKKHLFENKIKFKFKLKNKVKSNKIK